MQSAKSVKSIGNMQDFNELQQAKAVCLKDITEALPRYSERLAAIDQRLTEYVEVLSPPPIGTRLRLSERRVKLASTIPSVSRLDRRSAAIKQGEKETTN